MRNRDAGGARGAWLHRDPGGDAAHARHVGRKSLRVLFACVVAVVIAPPAARAHLASDSYLHLEVFDAGRIKGQWDIALRDLEAAVGLDANTDGKITWGETRAKRRELEAYALGRLSLAVGEGTCVLAPSELMVDRHAGSAYAVLRFDAACPRSAGPLTLRYRLLFDIDPGHKGLLTWTGPDGPRTAILSPGDDTVVLGSAAVSSTDELGRFFVSGFHHILQGYDHLLFVAVLLIVAPLRRVGGGRWIPEERPKRVIVETVRILTAFTVAHGTTLTLAVLGVIDAPARLIEPTVALTIMLAAIDNIRPILPRLRWCVAFAFGLIHGLAFASAFAPMELPPLRLALALCGFNLGIEAGQLSLALLLVPVALSMRRAASYARFFAPAISALAFLIASSWFLDRAFDLGLSSTDPAARLPPYAAK